MFQSFFPKPRLFCASAILWTAAAMALWYLGARTWGVHIGLAAAGPADATVVGLHYFWTPSFLWFYGYYAIAVALFAASWFVFSPHPWQMWSVFGTSAIVFFTYLFVQVFVAVNNWRRPFFDKIQSALSGNSRVDAQDFYDLIWIFASIAMIAIALFVLNRFLVSHWIFRWRTAMNNYYVAHWTKLRRIEGASQRVQEDTMRFASLMEGLGVSLIDALMTLIAFLPILASLSSYITELPIVGEIPEPLPAAALFWALFGTGLLAGVGVKLPMLEFRNQRAEAAYRKELVHGEDDVKRVQPITMSELFAYVRRNYFRLYFHYMYFNIFRSLYFQADVVFAYVLLTPTILAGASIGFTFGVMQQTLSAFGQVSSSFQYLVSSWPTVVDMLSVYKRLKTFEAAMVSEQLPEIDRKWLETHGVGGGGETG